MAHQERMERKQLQEQMAVMQQRFEQIFQASQKQPEPTPEYDDDPLGATHAKVDKALQSVQELRQMEVARQQQAQFTGYIENVKAAENAFMQKNPDYKDAVTYVQSRRVNELRTMGYDEQAAMQVLAQDAFALSQRAQQLGQSPAELIYNLAKQTGYAAKAAQPSNIDTIAAGQQVAKSVSGGANPVTEGGLPPNLADLSDSEFEALFKKMVK
jgi:paraquat-inducible protein B